jgi:hypothetical protein
MPSHRPLNLRAPTALDLVTCSREKPPILSYGPVVNAARRITSLFCTIAQQGFDMLSLWQRGGRADYALIGRGGFR